MKQQQISLKKKNLLLTGSVIITLMLIISMVLVFQWRKIIINKECQNAISVSNTFSVSIIDALIYQEQAGSQKENVIETYIDNFIYKLENVKYVIIYDISNTPIISRSRKSNNVLLSESLSPIKQQSERNEITIFYDKNFDWVLQSNFPLSIAGKYWGWAKIGFDAEPIRTEIQNIFFYLFGSTIFVSFITLLVLYFLSNYLTSSLKKLVKEIDKYNLDSEPETKIPMQNDEIGFLFQRFDTMKKRLENSKDQLEIAQKQIYQAEKLASIGRLASGVAHQVNNPLNGIKSCIYSIQKEPENLKQTKEYIDLINEGISSIEIVVQKLLGFARQQSRSGTFIDINESIHKVVKLFNYRLTEKEVELVLELDNNLPKINIDYYLFQEVIMNLILNSYDALETNGKIEISSGKMNNKCVFIKIKDNGSGIKKENLEKIFDPFFTTKDVGVGTGLGLSVCLGIIESHGGKISVISTEKEETIFTITLPIEIENESINN